MTGIEALLPDVDVVTHHETAVPIAPERALVLTLAMPAAPDRLVQALFRLRGLPTDRTLGDLFPLLEHTSTEAVFGLSGRPWRPTGVVGGFHEREAGTVRIAAGFRTEPLPEGCAQVVTETRIAAVDEAARRAFARYWRVVAPFSGLVRRRWLAAVRREAGRGAARV